MSNDSIVLSGFRFELTSAACPEQYDVFDEFDNLVGYVRFRSGRFLFYIIDGHGVRHDMIRARIHKDSRFRDVVERAVWLSLCADCLSSWYQWSDELTGRVNDEGIEFQDIPE